MALFLIVDSNHSALDLKNQCKKWDVENKNYKNRSNLLKIK